MEFLSFFGGGDGNSADNDDFDEFLFQSIQRYNTLQMFNLENVPHHLLQLGSDSLCVANERPNGRSELIKLKLPLKLTLPPEEEGLSKENDFKVLSGIYTDNLIYQIGRLGSDNLVLASEINVTGVQIYSFGDNLLGYKNAVRKLNAIQWTNPDFMTIQETSCLICSKCSHQPLIQVDTSVDKKIKDIKHPHYRFNKFLEEESKKKDPCVLNNIKCSAINSNLIAVLNTHNGDVFLHDLRTNNSFASLPKCGESCTGEIWVLSGCSFTESSLDYFGILSNTTSFCIYDIRKNGILLQRLGKSPPVQNHMNLKLKFSGEERKFSVSGISSFVEIFKIGGNTFEPIFTHNGHCPKNVPSVFVTDHIWLQSGKKEYIVSICNNKTLNCWN